MYRSPVQKENFQQAWDYGCRKYCRAKKSRLIRNLTVPISQLLFFLCFLILTYGIFYDGFEGLFRPFLQKIPYTAELWEYYSAKVFAQGTSLTWQLIAMGNLLYGIPVLAALLLWLLCCLIYHPAKPVLSQDPDLHPGNLFSVSQQITHYNSLRHSSTLTFCSVFYAVILAGGCVGFLLFYKDIPQVARLLQEGWAQASLYFLLAWLILFALYHLLNLPLRLVLSILSFTGTARNFPLDAERYYSEHLRIKNNQSDCVQETEET